MSLMEVRPIDKKTVEYIPTNKSIWKIAKKYKLYYLMVLPGVLYYILFKYVPLFGIIVAFKDISPYQGITDILTAPWVGLKHFSNFFNSYYFWQILGNTLLISLYKFIFSFTAPIILALLINEIVFLKYKKVIQTISYLPHFISLVVVAGLMTNILSTRGGIVNEVLGIFGAEPIFFLGESRYFRGVLVVSDIWKNVGWGTIIYLAGITGIDPGLYESAKMDGAGRFKQTLHITLPGIASIISIMAIMRMGTILDAGFHQVLTLYSPSVYDVADIIDTYVYRSGLERMQYSFSTAVGLFKSVIALVLVLLSNYLAKKLGQEGIW